MLAEFVDMFPESILIADGVVATGKINKALVATLFVLNTILTTLAILDSTLTSRSLGLNKFLLVLLLFVAGMLTYTISDDVFANLEDEFDKGKKEWSDVAMTAVGMIVGVLVYYFIIYATDPNFGGCCRKKDSQDVDPQADVDPLVEQPGDAQLRKDARKKFFKQCVCYLVLYGVMAGLAVLFAHLFASLYEDITKKKTMAFAHAFCEGISGGCFYAAVTCTVLPEIVKIYAEIKADETTNLYMVDSPCCVERECFCPCKSTNGGKWSACFINGFLGAIWIAGVIVTAILAIWL